MTATEDRKKHERAMELGRQARRASRKRDTNPFRAGTMTSERDSWHLGWDQADSAMKVRK